MGRGAAGASLLLAAVLTVLGLVGCAPARTVTVLAAASLTEAFDELAATYQQEHPGIAVRVSYGSSATLAAQVTAGARADVFASANEATMASLTEAGLPVEPSVLTTNRLQIAVPPGNPGRVEGLADFAREDLRIALCAKEVPCGSAARTLLDEAGVEASVDTYEVDVKATLRKVELGEADAALVYRTDVTSAGDRVRGLSTEGADRVGNTYLVTTLPDPPAGDRAAEFVAHVLSPAGHQVLARYGFGDG